MFLISGLVKKYKKFKYRREFFRRLAKDESGDFQVQQDDWRDWEDYEMSINWKIGNTSNEGSCPCENDYNLRFTKQIFDHKPTEEEINNQAAKVTEPDGPRHACTPPCEWANLDEWHDWAMLKHVRENQYKLYCFWNKQWHCEIVEQLPPPEEIQ